PRASHTGSCSSAPAAHDGSSQLLAAAQGFRQRLHGVDWRGGCQQRRQGLPGAHGEKRSAHSHCDYSSLVIEFARQGKNPCPEVVQWIDEKNRAVEHQIHSLRALQRKLRRFRRICSVSSVTTCAREEELCCLIEDLPNPQLEGDGHEKALLACSSPVGRTRS